MHPPIGSGDSSQEYDTFTGQQRTEDWIGYEFASPQTFAQLELQDGIQFSDGGWFTSLKVQVRRNGTWMDVPGAIVTPAYAGNDNINFETYTFDFPAITADAIRIDGTPGGANTFISVGELHVYAASVAPDGSVICKAVGACRAAGTYDSSAGQCNNPPAPDGISCDDLNPCTSNDACKTGVCVGNAFVPTTSHCGVGACVATGTTSCANGTLQDNCTPGTPAPDDATCNGVDDDCSSASPGPRAGRPIGTSSRTYPSRRAGARPPTQAHHPSRWPARIKA